MNPQRQRKLSRLISRLDRLNPGESLPEVEDGREIGAAFRIGVTGPLGSGKSSLINEIARNYRKRDMTVGIIAVDPTSPFTGGALLGDRIRMPELTLDSGVFIRSLATRGAFGGLTENANDAADLLDVFGFDRIIIETVGVGQSEVDIAGACDAALVVFEPGSGDGIQAMKAGLMEIADLFVVNKKDMKGADRFVLELETVLEMRHRDRRPPVMMTSAHNGEGVPELVEWLEGYYNKVQHDGRLQSRRQGQRIDRIKRAVEELLKSNLWKAVSLERLERASHDSRSVRNAARELVGDFMQSEEDRIVR
jgi:LAO/AO transport system kinase